MNYEDLPLIQEETTMAPQDRLENHHNIYNVEQGRANSC